jgi:hypothetical protein
VSAAEGVFWRGGTVFYGNDLGTAWGGLNVKF